MFSKFNEIRRINYETKILTQLSRFHTKHTPVLHTVTLKEEKEIISSSTRTDSRERKKEKENEEDDIEMKAAIYLP